ncbi:MAG: FHA domain-containing protein [Hyphomicrobium sp.]|jgi:hypothetical protein
MMMKAYRLATLLVLILALGQAAPARATDLLTSCEATVEGADGETVVCQVRTHSGKPITSVAMTDSSGEPVPVKLESYDWTKRRSSFYYIVQLEGVATEQMEQISTFLDRAAFPVGKQELGIAFAGSKLEEQVPIGSYRRELEAAARGLLSAGPTANASAVLSHLRDAIGTVAGRTSERKALVVLCTAKLATDGVSESEIIDLARERKVALYFVSFGAKDPATFDLISRLADKSGGSALDAGDASLSDVRDLSSRPSALLENGVIARVDARSLPHEAALIATAVIEGEGSVSADPFRFERLTSTPWLASLKEVLARNFLGILALLGLGAGVYLIAASRPKPAVYVPSEPADSNLPSHGAPPDAVATADATDGENGSTLARTSEDGEEAAVAWLELVDSEHPPVPLPQGTLRVGRSEDNDIRFLDKSVHRRHALLQMASDGTISIHDLGTRNGVLVNGARCSQQQLSAGDVVTLGEVKMRILDRLPT